MTESKNNSLHLLEETLVTLTEAAQDFGGISIPVNTVQKYVYQGIKGLKLESININGRYTSKEAIRRFIERKQNTDQLPRIIRDKETARTTRKVTTNTKSQKHQTKKHYNS